MLLSEQQTKCYLDEMIQHYGEKEINTSGHFSWERSEASYRRKAFEDMKMVLFGDEDNGRQQKQARSFLRIWGDKRT